MNVPPFLQLNNSGRSFEVAADCSGLSEGSVHYAEIVGFDSECSSLGPLFRVPITVIRPTILPTLDVFSPKGPEESGVIERDAIVEEQGGGSFSPSGAMGVVEQLLGGGRSSPAISAVVQGRSGPAAFGPVSPSITPTSVAYSNLWFAPGSIQRKFISVPNGASIATFTIAGVKPAGENSLTVSRRNAASVPGREQGIRRRFLLHALFLKPHVAFRDTDLKKYFYVEPDQKQQFTMSVQGGVVLELALAQFWSSLGEGAVHVSVDFEGVLVNGRGGGPVDGDVVPIVFNGSHQGILQLELSAAIGSVKVTPSLSLNVVLSPLRPTSHVLRPCLFSHRDCLPSDNTGLAVEQGGGGMISNPRHVWELILTYSFTVKNGGGKILLRAPLLQVHLHSAILVVSSFIFVVTSLSSRFDMSRIFRVSTALSCWFISVAGGVVRRRIRRPILHDF